MDAFDNCRVKQARPSHDQRRCWDRASTLPSGVVACRLLPVGYRVFAACSPPASSPETGVTELGGAWQTLSADIDIGRQLGLARAGSYRVQG